MTETMRDRSATPPSSVTVPEPRGQAAWLERFVARVTLRSGVTHTTLRARNDLAASYFREERYEDAAREFAETLTRCRDLLGDDHVDTLVAAGNLAAAHIAAGHPARAVPMLERAVADRSRRHGPRHPATLDARHGLGVALRDAGDPRAAGHVLRAALVDRVDTLGPTHPDSVDTRGVLASVEPANG